MTRATAHEVVRQVSLLHGVQVYRVLGKRRSKFMHKVRFEIASVLRGMGMSYPEIGRAMNRDHSTIHVLLNGKARNPKLYINDNPSMTFARLLAGGYWRPTT